MLNATRVKLGLKCVFSVQPETVLLIVIWFFCPIAHPQCPVSKAGEGGDKVMQVVPFFPVRPCKISLSQTASALCVVWQRHLKQQGTRTKAKTLCSSWGSFYIIYIISDTSFYPIAPVPPLPWSRPLIIGPHLSNFIRMYLIINCSYGAFAQEMFMKCTQVAGKTIGILWDLPNLFKSTY